MEIISYTVDVKIPWLNFSWKVVISKTLKSLEGTVDGNSAVFYSSPTGLLDFWSIDYGRGCLEGWRVTV